MREKGGLCESLLLVEADVCGSFQYLDLFTGLQCFIAWLSHASQWVVLEKLKLGARVFEIWLSTHNEDELTRQQRRKTHHRGEAWWFTSKKCNPLETAPHLLQPVTKKTKNTWKIQERKIHLSKTSVKEGCLNQLRMTSSQRWIRLEGKPLAIYKFLSWATHLRWSTARLHWYVVLTATKLSCHWLGRWSAQNRQLTWRWPKMCTDCPKVLGYCTQRNRHCWYQWPYRQWYLRPTANKNSLPRISQGEQSWAQRNSPMVCP